MDVKRIIAVVLLGSTLGIVFFVFYVLLGSGDDEDSGDAPMSWLGNSYAGLVVDIAPDHMMLHTRNGDNIRFKFDANTRFILRGNSPVRPGIEVKVTFRTIHGKASEAASFMARTIRVLREGEIGGEPKSTPSFQPHAAPAKAPRASPQPASMRGRPSEGALDVLDVRVVRWMAPHIHCHDVEAACRIETPFRRHPLQRECVQLALFAAVD